MSDDLATADEGAVRWQLQAGVDRNAFYLIAGGVVLLACFALLRAFGNPEGSPGRSVNFATAGALFLTVPLIVAIYGAARDGFVETSRGGLHVKIGFLVDTTIRYADMEFIGGPTPRPRSTYGVSPSYRRHEFSLGRLEKAVEIGLCRRVRMGTFLLFPFLFVERIWLGVSDPESLIQELQSRTLPTSK